jgi:hypothetical protein
MVSLVQPCDSIPGQQPSRSYYQLLGISPDEQDLRVIEEAALGCSNHVRAYQLTCESECTQRLNEIAQALITLLDPARRQQYDRDLGKLSGQPVPERRPPRQRPAAPGEGTLELLAGCGRACDVQLVYLIGPAGVDSWARRGRPGPGRKDRTEPRPFHTFGKASAASLPLL